MVGKAVRDRTFDIMTTATDDNLIELRVDDIAQLLHTLDPFPFRERDLVREAEEYIVGWVRELVIDQAIKIAIHFPETEIQTKAARELTEAFRRSFSDRAGIIQPMGQLRIARAAVGEPISAIELDGTFGSGGAGARQVA